EYLHDQEVRSILTRQPNTTPIANGCSHHVDIVSPCTNLSFTQSSRPRLRTADKKAGLCVPPWTNTLSAACLPRWTQSESITDPRNPSRRDGSRIGHVQERPSLLF